MNREFVKLPKDVQYFKVNENLASLNRCYNSCMNFSMYNMAGIEPRILGTNSNGPSLYVHTVTWMPWRIFSTQSVPNAALMWIAPSSWNLATSSADTNRSPMVVLTNLTSLTNVMNFSVVQYVYYIFYLQYIQYKRPLFDHTASVFEPDTVLQPQLGMYCILLFCSFTHNCSSY